MVKLQCSISAQDCSILFSPSTTLHKLPYALGSCVRDARLTGNVGRCGFPGAACVTDALGNDNCAYGGDNTVLNYKPLCQNGFCGGGLGATCTNGDFDCNWGYYCNTTAGFTGTCGGFNAFVDSQGDTGVDFAFDYCLSGKATQASTGSWFCTEAAGSVVGGGTSGGVSNTVGGSTANGGTGTGTRVVGGTSTIVGQTVTVIGSVTRTVSFTQTGTDTGFGFNPTNTSLNDGHNGNGSKHHSSAGLIAGVVAGVVVIIALLIVIIILWRRSQRNATNGGAPVHLPPTPQTAQFNVNGYTTEPLLAPQGLAGSSLATSPAPSSQVQQLTGSTATTPSFPNPASFAYLPEIQHDENAAARLSYPNTNAPGGFAPATMLMPNTPSSPAFAYAGSTGSGSSPPISPSPYATSYAQSGNAPAAPASGLNVNMVYGGSGSTSGMDATEKHLMAARMEADRELAQMRWDGRDS